MQFLQEFHIVLPHGTTYSKPFSGSQICGNNLTDKPDRASQQNVHPGISDFIVTNCVN
jgi:hypothetical protein